MNTCDSTAKTYGNACESTAFKAFDEVTACSGRRRSSVAFEPPASNPWRRCSNRRSPYDFRSSPCSGAAFWPTASRTSSTLSFRRHFEGFGRLEILRPGLEIDENRWRNDAKGPLEAKDLHHAFLGHEERPNEGIPWRRHSALKAIAGDAEVLMA